MGRNRVRAGVPLPACWWVCFIDPDRPRLDQPLAAPGLRAELLDAALARPTASLAAANYDRDAPSVDGGIGWLPAAPENEFYPTGPGVANEEGQVPGSPGPDAARSRCESALSRAYHAAVERRDLPAVTGRRVLGKQNLDHVADVRCDGRIVVLFGQKHVISVTIPVVSSVTYCTAEPNAFANPATAFIVSRPTSESGEIFFHPAFVS